MTTIDYEPVTPTAEEITEAKGYLSTILIEDKAFTTMLANHQEKLERNLTEKDKLEGKVLTIEWWNDVTNGRYGKAGVSTTTFSKLRRALLVIDEGYTIDDLNRNLTPYKEKYNSYRPFLNRAKPPIDKLKKYLEYTYEPENEQIDEIEKTKRLFWDKKWYAHFLDFGSEEKEKRTAVIIIDKKGIISIREEPTDDDIEHLNDGSLSYLEAMSGLLIINLRHSENFHPQIHFKLYNSDPDQELMVGVYIIFVTLID